MVDYLSDIKASHKLIEKIKQYYHNSDIPLNGARFWVESQIDHLGYKIYTIRSNIKFDVNKKVMVFSDEQSA